MKSHARDIFNTQIISTCQMPMFISCHAGAKYNTNEKKRRNTMTGCMHAWLDAIATRGRKEGRMNG
eukprot:scaffold379238_cov43-Prasinocladus_malaysianus.AAC.1